MVRDSIRGNYPILSQNVHIIMVLEISPMFLYCGKYPIESTDSRTAPSRIPERGLFLRIVEKYPFRLFNQPEGLINKDIFHYKYTNYNIPICKNDTTVMLNCYYLYLEFWRK